MSCPHVMVSSEDGTMYCTRDDARNKQRDERLAEIEKELIKARLDASGQKGLVAKLEKNSKHWAKRLDKAETKAADWKRVAGELATAYRLLRATSKDLGARAIPGEKALAAFEAMEKGTK